MMITIMSIKTISPRNPATAAMIVVKKLSLLLSLFSSPVFESVVEVGVGEEVPMGIWRKSGFIKLGVWY